ncbi:MAG: NAD(P)/FAD-dependent oxidoreductase [Spirochaetes bacterium]|nr:NAD(P)/FAD-dependent oxidoreductase [Spirochaetota bacterium]
MMTKSMIIAGSGIAGLSTGHYAQLNGYNSKIFEMHSIPGGLCTAWKRRGYTFDISMHALIGSCSGTVQRMWQELGVIENTEFHYRTEAAFIEGLEKSLSLSADPEKLLDQLTALSPEDEKLSQEFVQFVTGRDMDNAMSLKPPEISGLKDKLKMFTAVLPLLKKMGKYGKMTYKEFLQGFRDPFLREALRCFIDSPGWPMERFPMVAMAGMANSGVTKAGVPLGGSQKVVFGIAEKYSKLGGEIIFKKRVIDIIIENDRAAGVILEDGSEHRADVVVWAGDGHTVIFDILGGKYIDERIQDMYNNWIPVQALIHVSIGVARDLSGQPSRYLFELEKPLNIAGQERRWISLIHRCFDTSMAPPGKSAVEVWYPSSYEYWEKLSGDRPKYEAEKQRIADATIAELDKRWPGFISDIEVVDVATPATYVRYTGNWKGSPDGWYITPENMADQSPLRSLPGLASFYMVGQWTAPFTGTIMAAVGGRQLIELLCVNDGKAFVSSE